MSPLVWMLTLWGVLTGVLVVLLIYRSTLTMQEDEQLFLDDTKSALEQAQRSQPDPRDLPVAAQALRNGSCGAQQHG